MRGGHWMDSESNPLRAHLASTQVHRMQVRVITMAMTRTRTRTRTRTTGRMQQQLRL